MKSRFLGAAAAVLLSGGVCLAQPAPATTGGMSTTTSPGMSPRTTVPADTSARGSVTDRNKDTAAASGNTNQAVATTSANAPAPAKGANSFTMGEAKSRLERNGFANVSNLVKDHDGIWRGNAQKGGKSTPVWLDYKGNVGDSQ